MKKNKVHVCPELFYEYLILFVGAILLGIIGVYVLGAWMPVIVFFSFMVFPALWVAWVSRRAFLTVHISEKGFRSYFLWKEQAFVSKERPIYYSFFSSPSVGINHKYCLISNVPFELLPHMQPAQKGFNKSILHRFDLKTQLVLPYNSKTMKFIECSNWKAQHVQR